MADFLFWSIHQKLAAHVLQWNCQQHTNGGKRMAYLYVCVCMCVCVCVCVWKQCYKNHSWQHEHTLKPIITCMKEQRSLIIYDTQKWPPKSWTYTTINRDMCATCESTHDLISSHLLSSPLLSSSSSCTSPPPLLFTRCNPMCSKGILPYTKKIATPTTIHKVFNVVCFTRLLV